MIVTTLFRNIAALFLIVILLSLTVWNGFDFYKMLTDKSEPIVNVPETAFKSRSKNIPSPETISRWHLMGENKPDKPIKAPKTTLRLKLIGIISSTVDGQARAIIEVSPRKHQYFKVGDDIKKNVKVKFINTDHIIIDHNSREEIVPLISMKSKTPIIKKVVNK